MYHRGVGFRRSGRPGEEGQSLKRHLLLVAVPAILVTFACGEDEEVNVPSTVSPSTTMSPIRTHASNTPAPSATSGWETYSDIESHFTIGHPSGLSVDPEEKVTLTGGGVHPEVTMRILTLRLPSGTRALDIGIADNPRSLSAEEWVAGYDPCTPESDPALPRPSATTVGGYAAFVCPVDQLNQVNPRVYVAAGTEIFVFVGNVNGLPESGEPAGISHAEFDAVLASFKKV